MAYDHVHSAAGNLVAEEAGGGESGAELQQKYIEGSIACLAARRTAWPSVLHDNSSNNVGGS